MAFYDKSFFLAIKAMRYGEFSYTWEIVWCSWTSKMQCISEFHIREASSIDVTWWGLQPRACFLAFENGAFGWCWYLICDVLELPFMQAIFGCSIASFVVAIVSVCLAASKVVSSFNANEMKHRYL